jgi:hypothetical protein
MDKQLLKAYIKTIVEDEVKRILPELLSEAVSEIKQLSENKRPNTPPQPQKKSTLDRGRLAELMGMTYDGETIRANTGGMAIPLPENAPRDADPEVVKAITKDYSQLMKAMKIV